MTLNNFEKQAKERLNEREIQPANRAWTEISAALEENKKRSKSNYFWYGIAAGFIGLLIISTIYLKQSSAPEKDDQIIVSQEDKVNFEKEQTIDEQEVLFPTEPILDDDTVVKVPRKEISKKPLAEPQKSTVIADVNTRVDKGLNPKVIASHSEDIIDAKLEELLARVEVLEGDNTALTDAEVDSLLRQAQREILTNQILQQPNAVDATALLSEVEDELEQSFRDQIFDKLKTGFNKVRTAVADRNN